MSFLIYLPQDVAAAGKDFLLSHGYELRIGATIEEATLCHDIVGCDAVLARNPKITRAVLQAEAKLKVVARHGVGVDTVDVEAATEMGIWVTNAPFSNSETVAEHVLLSMLALARHLLTHDRELRRGNFEIRNQRRGHDLAGKTLGILGLGRIGSLVARKAVLGLGMKVITATRTPRVVEEWVERVETREEVFRRSDFLSLLLPSTPETYHSVSAQELGWMKPTAYLINTGRGDVIEEAALVAALRSGGIAGAALDVFEEEPPSPENPLFSLDNVIVTPHSAALTMEAMERMSLHAAQGIHDVLTGKRPQWPVNEPAQLP
jgi:D-3-phosphoglycerate dehydrogenase